MWRGYHVLGYYDTTWLSGLWFNLAKVEVTVLKAEWYWGSVSNGKRSARGTRPHCILCAFRPRGTPSIVTVCSRPISREGSYSGDSDTYERMNKALALEVEHPCP